MGRGGWERGAGWELVRLHLASGEGTCNYPTSFFGASIRTRSVGRGPHPLSGRRRILDGKGMRGRIRWPLSEWRTGAWAPHLFAWTCADGTRAGAAVAARWRRRRNGRSACVRPSPCRGSPGLWDRGKATGPSRAPSAYVGASPGETRCRAGGDWPGIMASPRSIRRGLFGWTESTPRRSIHAAGDGGAAGLQSR